MLARDILTAMHLVAVACSDPDLAHRLRNFRDGDRRFHLHPVSPGSVLSLVDGLRSLDFAGALLLDEKLQREAAVVVDRGSLEVREGGAADTLIVTPAGVVADLHLGRAVGAALRARLWDPRGAQVVVLGADLRARAVARELASLGVKHLTVLAADRPEAERAVARLAVSTTVEGRAYGEGAAETLLAMADLVVRIDPAAEMAPELFGPHLSLVDLSAGALTSWRRQAMAVGAMAIGERDVQAHVLHASLGAVLGSGLRVEPLLALLHEA